MSQPAITSFREHDRELQARYAVVWPHRVLAEAARMKAQTISSIACAVYPVTLFRGFQFAQIQNDYRLLASLAERIEAVLTPRRPQMQIRHSPEMFSQIVTSFGRFLLLFEKVARGERLSDAEMRELESSGGDIEDIVQGVKEQARKDRRPTTNTDD